ncbi:hypothetical protein NWV39_003846 [Salmonella enterica]|uniref:Uncharacterized protein n=1 Tax=Salmonella enterica subsp. enterica serovar Poona TaxID=436295 RepID=A0A5V6N9B7_SALET|nr:hypothetical protein [Salmonella enterica]EBS4764032.1 hypothetical protein [Salmonella enterica subsp. enterica serovar Poona]EBS5403439.1 hypothetical protein [Salmonella enterica subsp. enterica serovar Oranienburg]EDL3544141.1 hypothetical protein [Salmonella enterica subsp. enterica serovar Newport]EGR8150103.1 hypothetical protein [Salmonella enterica subsp. enterica serovar Adelaide]EHK9247305.1 hypothetical protein [Salmonella enterica subsp. enterica serovar Panama]
MRDFFLTMTPEQWEKLKNSPRNFPVVEDFFPSQPEPGDRLRVRYQRPRSLYNTETITELGECAIASAIPTGSTPHRYRLKVTFSMTPEQVKQRYGCRCTKLSSILCRYKEQEAEKEHEKLERSRRILAHKAEIAAQYLKKQ